MNTNELKKGDIVRLRNGWLAVIEDNKKGNTRVATVHGHYTEAGSVYSHDIVTHYRSVLDGPIGVANVRAGDGSYESVKIIHTPAQLKLKARVEEFGF